MASIALINFSLLLPNLQLCKSERITKGLLFEISYNSFDSMSYVVITNLKLAKYPYIKNNINKITKVINIMCINSILHFSPNVIPYYV